MSRLDQPDRKATSFSTSHFYLDFVKASALAQRPRTRMRGGTKAEPALLRTTWRETPRPARWPATSRGRLPSRTVCAALQTALRQQRTSWVQRPRKPSAVDVCDRGAAGDIFKTCADQRRAGEQLLAQERRRPCTAPESGQLGRSEKNARAQNSGTTGPKACLLVYSGVGKSLIFPIPLFR